LLTGLAHWLFGKSLGEKSHRKPTSSTLLNQFLHHFTVRKSNALGPIVQDGAPAHRAKHTREVEDNFAITRLEWPASSPDLNPIETLWRTMKHRLDNLPHRPTTVSQMVEALRAMWAELQASTDTLPILFLCLFESKPLLPLMVAIQNIKHLSLMLSFYGCVDITDHVAYMYPVFGSFVIYLLPTLWAFLLLLCWMFMISWPISLSCACIIFCLFVSYSLGLPVGPQLLSHETFKYCGLYIIFTFNTRLSAKPSQDGFSSTKIYG